MAGFEEPVHQPNESDCASLSQVSTLKVILKKRGEGRVPEKHIQTLADREIAGVLVYIGGCLADSRIINEFKDCACGGVGEDRVICAMFLGVRETATDDCCIGRRSGDSD